MRWPRARRCRRRPAARRDQRRWTRRWRAPGRKVRVDGREPGGRTRRVHGQEHADGDIGVAPGSSWSTAPPSQTAAHATPSSGAALRPWPPGDDAASRQGEHRVQQGRSGRPGEQAGRAAHQAAESLTQVPDQQRPDHRGRQRTAGGPRVEDAGAEHELDQPEGHICDRRLVRDDPHQLADRARDEARLPRPGRGDDLDGELRSQHRRLELQQAVQHPQQPQHDLDAPPGDAEPGRGRCGPESLLARLASAAAYLGQSRPAGGPPWQGPSLAPGSLIHR